jgi:diamine N-acetyltransferase
MTWRPVTRDNWQETLGLSVQPAQVHFVAEYEPIAAIGLAKAYVRPGGQTWLPYALYADETMVGFTMLAYQPGSRDEYWIFHFFIDRRFQGRGYGKAGLDQFIGRVSHEYVQCRTLQLTVHSDNRRAQQLYLSVGFRPADAERWGERVYRLPLRDAEQQDEGS